MEGLTQEEKDKLWTELKAQWKLVKEGQPTDAKKAQKRINEIQGTLGLDVTDFESEQPTKEIKEYTLAEAEEQFNEGELEEIEKALDKAIAFRELVADLVIKKYPKLKNNPAGVGQMVNITYDLVKGELK